MALRGTETNELALSGGQPVRPEPLPQGIVATDELRAFIDEVLEGGHLSQWYNGPYARRFEDEFAAWQGPDLLAIGVNSGTSALHLAFEAAGIGPGDEIVVPALCFVAVAVAVVQLGAVPVICDIDPGSLTLDPAAVAEVVGPRTRAVAPVHFWGYPADLGGLRALCDEHGLALIEDSCQAPGATAGGARTGTVGDYAAFSFANRKHLSTGEGGMVLTRSAERLEHMRALANCGKGEGWDDYRTHGYSYRMTELIAAAGLYGLARLDGEIAARRAAAEHYRAVLAGFGLEPVPEPSWGEAVYFKLPVLLPPEHASDRAFLVEAIAAENVSCRTPHRPLYEIPWLNERLEAAGRFRGAEECPVTASLFPRLFEVETGPNLPLEEAYKSAAAVEKVWRSIIGG